jgi:hypothetical protein
LPQILSIEPQQVEIEVRETGWLTRSILEQLETRDSALVKGAHFTVDDELRSPPRFCISDGVKIGHNEIAENISNYANVDTVAATRAGRRRRLQRNAMDDQLHEMGLSGRKHAY